LNLQPFIKGREIKRGLKAISKTPSLLILGKKHLGLLPGGLRYWLLYHMTLTHFPVKNIKQPHNRPEAAQRVPGS